MISSREGQRSCTSLIRGALAKPEKLEFVFAFDPQYRLFPSNGVWGGLTPRGDMRLEFFVETFAQPTRVVNVITSDGNLGEETERTPAQGEHQIITRSMQVGVMIPGSQLESIAEFLRQKSVEWKALVTPVVTE
jgi:hypothetical protein